MELTDLRNIPAGFERRTENRLSRNFVGLPQNYTDLEQALVIIIIIIIIIVVVVVVVVSRLCCVCNWPGGC